jgi:hypothetical protein
LDNPGLNSWHRQEIFLFFRNVQIPSPNAVVAGILSQRLIGQAVKLTTNYHLVLRLRKSGILPPLPHIPSLHALGLLATPIFYLEYG